MDTLNNGRTQSTSAPTASAPVPRDAAATPAHQRPRRAAVIDIRLEQGDGAEDIVVELDGLGVLRDDRHDPSWVLALLGSSAEFLLGNLPVVIPRLRDALKGREVPLLAAASGIGVAMDIKTLFADLVPEAKPKKARLKSPCGGCGKWVSPGAPILWHPPLRRVLACGACAEIELPKDLSPHASEIAAAAKVLNYESVAIADVTDVYDAMRFSTHTADFRYVSDSASNELWREWTGTHWRTAAEPRIRRGLMIFSRCVVRDAEREAAATEDDAEAAAWSEFARHWTRRQNTPLIARVLRLLPSLTKLQATEHQFDGSDTDHLLNCRNGTVDLRTGELRTHRREDYLTCCLDLDYDPEAKAPRFEQFLNEVFEGDTEMVGFIGRALGYAATAETKEEKVFICYDKGCGGTGKSTLMDRIYELLNPGAYARNIEPESFSDDPRETIRSDLMRTKGARFGLVNEAERRMRLAEALVKKFASGNPYTGRNLYVAPSELRPTAKLFFTTNYAPAIKGQDEAIWDRILVIPFNRRFRGTSTESKDLKDDLRAEFKGILAWLVRGAREWYAHGLQPPKKVLAATAEFRAQQEPGFQEWFNDRCVSGPPNGWVSTEVLYLDYEGWSDRHDRGRISKIEFGKHMARVPGLQSKVSRQAGPQQRGYVGLSLKE